MPYLINCPSCKKSVSTDAKRCPHCGRNIEAYIKTRDANKPHEKKISKASGKICITVLVAIFVTLGLLAFSAFFSISASSEMEMHKIAQEISPEHYDGHYEASATAFTVASISSLIIAIILGLLLTVKAIKIIKVQLPIIKYEKSLLVSEEHFK